MTPFPRPPDDSRTVARTLKVWTRRLHFWLGLYLLLFVWLFAVSGLLLNHPEWEFTRYWPRRQEVISRRTIAPTPVRGDIAIARSLIVELGIAGEITQVERRPADNLLIVQVNRPGRIHRVEADLVHHDAKIVETTVNTIGIIDVLHKFTGVRMDDASQQRDWALTTIWAIAMDGVAIGLLALVASGLYLWYRLGKKRIAGLLALVSGTVVCACFVFGLTRPS
ncbi:MAG TPA: PepSY-associated TM helix domain-containing protein [Gemmatimonadaceae bacterium]